jgi:hypothetical protein
MYLSWIARARLQIKLWENSDDAGNSGTKNRAGEGTVFIGWPEEPVSVKRAA